MYARVLFSWPDEPKWSGIKQDASEIDVDIFNILKRTDEVAQFTADGYLVDRPAQLDAEALAQFTQLAQWADKEKSAYEGREREWFAKTTAHVLRLAGTITFMEWGLTTERAAAGHDRRRGGESGNSIGARIFLASRQGMSATGRSYRAFR
jgi:hypothetical protein